jgi:hypothetical protein
LPNQVCLSAKLPAGLAMPQKLLTASHKIGIVEYREPLLPVHTLFAPAH